MTDRPQRPWESGVLYNIFYLFLLLAKGALTGHNWDGLIFYLDLV